jgi:hypothetical protein
VDATDSAVLLPRLLQAAELGADVQREPIRVWARSGVERIRLEDGGTVVFKYAEAPFDREHIALREASAAGLPVPDLVAAHAEGGQLGMLLEDLGEPVREATDQDGAGPAVRLHRIPGSEALDELSAASLAALPARIYERAKRFDLTPQTIAAARALSVAAAVRVQGAELPPFGLCHSEFHPSSLHIGPGGWHLLDLARAFVGPGLIDLASWHGTIEAPNPDRTTELIGAYIKAGGASSALADRGGLPAERWALGWHRVWVANWFAEQVERGWARGAMETWSKAVERHTLEAADLLRV